MGIMHKNLFTAPDLKTLLAKEYKSRHQRNPGYSHRAFARDLGLTPSQISDLLKGRRGLAHQTAMKVARALGYTTMECELFWNLIESKHAGSDLKRKAARIRLKAMRDSLRVNKLSIDLIEVVSEWYHFAILEMIALKDFRYDVGFISEALGLQPQQVEEAIARLIRVKMARVENGQLKAANTVNEIGGEIPSVAIRALHRNVLFKAVDALEAQPMEKRDFSTNIVAVSKREFESAKARLDDFIRQFTVDFGSGDSKDELYCFSTQLFSLQQSPSGEVLR